MDTDPEMLAVDELLDLSDPAETTGCYDARFFGTRPGPSPLQRLDDACLGLQVFLEEAAKALEFPSDELTPDQRIHISTIATFIEGLGKRFDRIRVPGYVQRGIRHTP